MANKARSKCCTKSGEEHEYKGQPRYSADEYLFNRAADKSVRLERSKEKWQNISYCKKGEGTKGGVK